MRGARESSQAHGRRRRPCCAHAGRGSLARRAQGRNLRRRAVAGDRAAPRADLRQGAGRPLQSHLRPAQVGARLRPGRRALLSLPHARRRRAAALHRAPRGAHGDRRHRPCRSAGAGDRQCRQGRLRLPWFARRRTGDCRGGALCGDRAEIQCRLCRLRRRHARGEGSGFAVAAQAHPQCADQTHAGGRLRPRLRLRPRRRRGLLRARIIFPTRCRASSSTIRPSAASSARSGSGWNIGPSCARSGAGHESFAAGGGRAAGRCRGARPLRSRSPAAGRRTLRPAGRSAPRAR